MDYEFVKIPYITCYYHHDFILGGPQWPICGTTETILGVRGSQLFNTGFIYAPFVPMVVDGGFEPRRSIGSRYATRRVNNRYYGAITV